jgi:hypothetical protein
VLPKRLRLASPLLSVPLLALMSLCVAAPAAAFELTNCTLSLTSMDADGAVLDTAQGPGIGATSDDPFEVDWDGTVHYVGTSGAIVLRDHSWHIDVFMIPTPLRGGDPNTGGDTDGEDTVGVGENAPFQLVGLFYVSGEIVGTDGSCAGNGWFKIDGNPLTTIPFWAAVVIALLGAVLLWFARPSARPAA